MYYHLKADLTVMKKEEALRLMEIRVEELKELFCSLPFSLKTETEFLTPSMKHTDNIKKARILAVSLIITDSEGVDEFYLTLCADAMGGRVSEEELEKSLAQYKNEAESFASELKESSDPQKTFKDTVKQTNEESEKFRLEMKKRMFRAFILTAVGLLISVGAIVLTTLFA